MCSFGLQFIFSFSTQPFYKNYWMLDSHTNTVFHTVVYQTPYFTQLSTLKDGFQNRDEVFSDLQCFHGFALCFRLFYNGFGDKPGCLD